ncbi:MAG: outer membrane protein assembly factor BamB family protein [Hasllibacter sp.]
MTATSTGRAALLLAALTLSACAERDVILTGQREPIRPQDAPAATQLGPRAFAAPAQTARADCPMIGCGPEHDAGHAALRPAPQLVWRTAFGAANDRRRVITAAPVIAGGRVFVQDALTGVSALSTSGALLWRTELTPPADAPGQASGGGLAIEGGTLFATTGYGELHALDTATGGRRWTQDLRAAATGAPTPRGGIVYVAARDAVGWAVDAATGRVEWRLSGLADASGRTHAPAPMVSSDLVVFPHLSEQLVGAFRLGGTQRWTAQLAGARIGSAGAVLTDIAGAPVLSGGTIYAGNVTGRIGAFTLSGGERVWTAREGAAGPLAVAGDSVFAVTDDSAAIRLDRATGATIWRTELPGLIPARRADRRRGEVAHFGPVLAGGRLWIAGSDGVLRGLDPAGGSVIAQIAIPSGAASQPAVAGGTLYVVGRDGHLNAYR